jgi:hypothetical protein
MRHSFGEIWDCKEVFPGTGDYHWLSDGRRGSGGCKSCPDIIAKWNPVEAGPDPVKPAKRDLRTIDEHELFGKLDERTQKRLRKAAKRGWPVQMFYISAWCELGNPSFLPDGAYRLDPAFTPPAKRVKPKPVCATITQDMWLVDYYPMNGVPVTITFTRTNGEIDNDSYKVEVKG